MDKFFAYSDDTGVDTFQTAEEAKAAAQESIEGYQENAHEGWDECVANVRWGEIKEQATEFDCDQQIEFEGEMVDAVDYRLEEI